MSEVLGQSGHALPILRLPLCAKCGLMHRSEAALQTDHLVGHHTTLSKNYPQFFFGYELAEPARPTAGRRGGAAQRARSR
jgi:hypothetical protein